MFIIYLYTFSLPMEIKVEHVREVVMSNISSHLGSVEHLQYVLEQLASGQVEKYLPLSVSDYDLQYNHIISSGFICSF